MKTIHVFDFPTRILHGLVAVGFSAAFLIGKTVDDDSALFPIHMLIGLTLVFVAALRLIWGVIGSHYARFSTLPLRPTKLVRYLLGLASGRSTPTIGHNPASAWLLILILLLIVGLGSTGYLMASGINKELWEEVHEIMANTFLVAVIAHLGGIILHQIKHRDGIAFSMIHGKKQMGTDIQHEAGLPHSYRTAGFVFLVLIVGFTLHLARSYDPQTGTLNSAIGDLQLGEAEESTGYNDKESDEH